MEYQQSYQLKNLNSFRTEAVAKKYCRPKTVRELQQVIKENLDEKKLLLGGGCNLFFTKDFDGLVIHPNIKGLREAWDDEDFEEEREVYIEVNASEDWDEFVEYCVRNGFSGVENLSLIPGTVGACPVQNIGAYGSEVKDVIREVVAIDMQTGEVVSFNNSECAFGYRDSMFKRTQRYAIVSVVFHLKKAFKYKPKYTELNHELEQLDEEPTLQDVRDAVIRIRQRKLPNEKELPNAGSFFKNPCISKDLADDLLMNYPSMPAYPQADGTVKTSAAFLVDQSGYKGKRIGEIGTYPNQPLIIVNYGTSDGNEIVRFMKEVQAAVMKNFGIDLEPEVRIF